MKASRITRFAALRSLKKVATVVAALAAISIGTGTLAAAPASAATGITGCFNYRGVAYTNVVTQLESYTTSGWQALPETISHTDSTGCYSYSVYGSWSQLNIRVVAAAWAPALRGFLWDTTDYYAKAGTGTASLGNEALSYISAAKLPAPAKNGSLSESWIDGMTRGGNSCNSAALAVACYMDSHGMVGNVVVQYVDSDGDRVLDTQDRYPLNKYKS